MRRGRRVGKEIERVPGIEGLEVLGVVEAVSPRLEIEMAQSGRALITAYR